MKRLYWFLVRALGLMERRCMTCKKLLGYKRTKGADMAQYGPEPQSHGLCAPCAVLFEAKADAVAEQVQKHYSPRRQRRNKRNIRRSLGGWGGAVAAPRRRP